MDDRTRAKVRRTLEDELDQVIRRLKALREDARPQEMEAGGDNTPFSEPEDMTQASEARDTGTQQIDWLVNRSVALNDARRRLDNGTYGICAACGRAIEPERLRAVPEATLCLRDQAEDEQRTTAHARRPALGAQPLD